MLLVVLSKSKFVNDAACSSLVSDFGMIYHACYQVQLVTP